MADRSEKFYRFIVRIVRPLHRLVPAALSIDEKRKRLMVVGGALLGIPTLVFFAVQGVLIGETAWVIADSGLAVVIAVSIVILRKVRDGMWVYRVLILGLLALLLYNLYTGTSGQSSVIWLFIYPITTFYILGMSEGIVWFGMLLFATIPAVLSPRFPGMYTYPIDMRLRLLFALVIVGSLSAAFELLRWFFYTKLEHQRLELQEALDNIRTLSGLLPICSICKKIRDDHGYWKQLEEYLAQHTDAKFSHGMCEDCLAKYYPEVHAKRLAKRTVAGDLKQPK